jgi:hypothetical protein
VDVSFLASKIVTVVIKCSIYFYKPTTVRGCSIVYTVHIYIRRIHVHVLCSTVCAHCETETFLKKIEISGTRIPGTRVPSFSPGRNIIPHFVPFEILYC